MAKKKTQAQEERQNRRWRNRGRYSEMLKCESCGTPVGTKHYSLPDCNETGVGVTLCKKCYNEETANNEKLGIKFFRGLKLVVFISETKKEGEIVWCDPKILHQTLKEHRRKGRNIHLPDHPTETSPMGYPVMCFGKAHGCSHCVRCIMDYYKEEVEEAKNR